MKKYFLILISVLICSTAIHETAHYFAGSAACIDSEYASSTEGKLSYTAPAFITSVLLNGKEIVHILQSSVFPAAEINDCIQDDSIYSTNRYKTYISFGGMAVHTE